MKNKAKHQNDGAKNENRKSGIYKKYQRILKMPDLANMEIDDMRSHELFSVSYVALPGRLMFARHQSMRWLDARPAKPSIIKASPGAYGETVRAGILVTGTPTPTVGRTEAALNLLRVSPP